MTEESYQHNEELETDVVLQGKRVEEFELILYNDDYNTFEHVINCLVKYCKHDICQAEQCAWLIHYKGKYAVKNGSYDDLKPLCDAITERGIGATLEVTA